MTTTTETDSKHDGAYRGRRLTWEQFYRLFPERRPANENDKPEVRNALHG